MNKNKPENPQAFPELYINDPHLALACAKGMTLRDHFAGRIAQGIESNFHEAEYCKGIMKQAVEKKMSLNDFIADMAYKQADALLKRRENES